MSGADGIARKIVEYIHVHDVGVTESGSKSACNIKVCDRLPLMSNTLIGTYST